MVAEQMAGVTLPGMRSPEAAVRILLSAGFERIERGSGVCVSHDAVLMPAIAWLFGIDSLDGWLAPLDGFVMRIGRSGPVLLWKGKERLW